VDATARPHRPPTLLTWPSGTVQRVALPPRAVETSLSSVKRANSSCHGGGTAVASFIMIFGQMSTTTLAQYQTTHQIRRGYGHMRPVEPYMDTCDQLNHTYTPGSSILTKVFVSGRTRQPQSSPLLPWCLCQHNRPPNWDRMSMPLTFVREPWFQNEGHYNMEGLHPKFVIEPWFENEGMNEPYNNIVRAFASQIPKTHPKLQSKPMLVLRSTNQLKET
jgi:hypothetical protein